MAVRSPEIRAIGHATNAVDKLTPGIVTSSNQKTYLECATAMAPPVQQFARSEA